MSNHTENLIWGWVHGHPWWWTMMQFFTLFISVRILRLAPAMTLWGRIIRMWLLGGLVCYTMGFWNSGLSVPGTAMIFTGLWLWVEQLIGQCLRVGHIRPISIIERLKDISRARAIR